MGNTRIVSRTPLWLSTGLTLWLTMLNHALGTNYNMRTLISNRYDVVYT